ncbi:tetratricopeptide repeat protein [Vagococcus sp. BWB3-3]|uniref:Tetratricopeptide repeat protein n=1 Tax=Vagococcus allomyrinae TaxID=2794353 RepID=A0A940SUC0_9ENTE|nr:tetratricopeptide repeat protein [Vagococcus allomyrinae]MBP1040604.1 tetratricopeptide repeat protein [Vagococcus allomyrinae]
MNSYSEQMLNAISDNDLIEAQLKFEEALRSDAPDILAQLGEQLLGAGFLEEATTVFKQLLEAYPEELGLNIPLAEIAIENGEMEVAFDCLENIPNDHPSYVESLLVIADMYQMMGVPEVSEKKIKEAQQLMPGEPILILALAELYYASDKFVEAIAIYESLLAKEASEELEINLYERLGSSLSMIGEFEEAIPYLEHALEDEQTDQRLFLLGVTYIQLGEREKAISLLQQLQVLNPSFEAVYLPLASALLDEELLEEAEQVMAEGLKQNPYGIDLYHLASDNAYRLGKIAEAEEYMRKAVNLEEDKEFSLIKLSNILLADERFEEVVETLAGLENSNQPHANWSLAQAYNELEEFKLAAENYDKAAEALGHEADFLKDYGLFLRAEGRTAEAKRILTHYLEHAPGDLEIYQFLEE